MKTYRFTQSGNNWLGIIDETMPLGKALLERDDETVTRWFSEVVTDLKITPENLDVMNFGASAVWLEIIN